MRQRWRVGSDCKSEVLRDLAGSNPAIPTEEGRLKNKEQGVEKFEFAQPKPSPFSIPCSLFLLPYYREEFSERLLGIGHGLENRSLARGVGSNPTSSAEEGRLKNKEQGIEKFELTQITP